jgi:hypothetical protein
MKQPPRQQAMKQRPRQQAPWYVCYERAVRKVNDEAMHEQPNPGDRLTGHCEDCGHPSYVGTNPLLGCEWGHGSHSSTCAYIERIGGNK